MPRNNFVYLKGRIHKPPHFGMTPGDESERTPFLQFYLDVLRDPTQPARFASDSLRVVMYSHEATALYPRLREGLIVSLVGWIQHRIYRRGKTVMEVVAQEVQAAEQHPSPAGEIGAGNVMAQLQDLARRRNLSLSETLDALLAHYLEQAQDE